MQVAIGEVGLGMGIRSLNIVVRNIVSSGAVGVVSLWPNMLQNAIAICIHRQGNMSLMSLAQAISTTGMHTLSRNRTAWRGKTLPLGLLGIFPLSFCFN